MRGTAPITRCRTDRKSTRLNSSHRCISYAVFCLKKKKLTEWGDQCARDRAPCDGMADQPPPWCRLLLRLCFGSPTPAPPATDSIFFFFFLMIRRPPRSPLFPYPTLFR